MIYRNACPTCGKEKDYRAHQCKSCATSGPNNPMWRGASLRPPRKCPDCGKEICSDLRAKKCGSCSQRGLRIGRTFSKEVLDKLSESHRGAKHWNWQGGRHLNYAGYIQVYQPDHPHCDKHNKILEHRLIMEKKLNRYLLPEEIVHHIDMNPLNNAPENLTIFPGTGEHVAYHRRLEFYFGEM